MKRLIAVLVVVALVMTGAFAQISFGGYGSSVFGVKGGAGAKDAVPFLESAWGANNRMGFTIVGTSDNIGFQVDMHADGNPWGDIGIGDVAKIWWKANDIFTLSLGKVQGDALRGKIGDWSEFRALMGGMESADAIFTRFYPIDGAFVEITPVDGLYIGAAVDADGVTTAEKMFKEKSQIGVGYSIDGVGLLRAQYISANGGVVEVAFAPSFFDGVTLDVGAKIPFDAKKAKYDAKASVGTAFNIDAVAVMARVDTTIAETKVIDAYVTPSVGLDFATIGLDASVYVDIADKTSVGFGVAPWISKGYSNGSVKAGVVLTKENADAEMGWAIPVAFTYWF